MAGSLSAVDWLIIAALVIGTVILIYLLGWLIIIAVIAIASAYLVYKWHKSGRPLAPT